MLPFAVNAQLLPKEGSKLNYRLIGFSFPGHAGHSDIYKLEVASGNYNTEDSFKKHIIKTLSSKEQKVIAEVPFFGTQYTWRTVNTSIKTKSSLYHFSTLTIPDVDTSTVRFRILHSAEKYKDAYVFLDGSRALYDMNGQPVWFVPDIDTSGNEDVQVHDLKISPQGTITFIRKGDIYDINYNGDILWKGPNTGKVSGDVNEHYHHEFTRLKNGHYMVLGAIPVIQSNKNHTTDSNVIADGRKVSQNFVTSFFPRVPLGTIIEYDEQGNVVWSWRSADYYKESDLVNYMFPDGQAHPDMHENSFFFDENSKTIYLSSNSFSRILKIKYPEGNVINTYGEIYKPGAPVHGNKLFSSQHSVKLSQIGCLFLFNNNGENPGKPPKVKILKEPVSKDDSLKIIWEYECTTEGMEPIRFGGGGNVIELPGNALFVSMNSPYYKVFIVNNDKHILWSAISEKWNAEEKKWDIIPQYRASIIPGHKELEQLICNS